jgi:hypothetical protein
MAKKLKQALISKQETKLHRYLIAFPAIAFAIKLITIFNIQGGGWLGADGENYLKGVDALHLGGLFSKAEILNYWPAGYPILIWLLAFISISKLIYLISLIQSLFFAYATYYLTRNLSKTSAAWIAFPVSLFISFNPTLSLSTLAIGYEAPVAACFMMALGILLSSKKTAEKRLTLYAVYAGLWVTLAAFMQPRYLLIGFVIFAIWGLSVAPKKSGAMIVLIASAVSLFSPAIMITRNLIAIDRPIISTNLSAAINYGAGENATGGYNRVGDFVPCKPKPPATQVSDNQTIACVFTWYLKNPTKTAKLTFNKSEFYWSPWSGPLANGTMARNPWLKISPVQNLLKNQSGAQFVTGPFGKLISWLWIIGQILFVIMGFNYLRKDDLTSRLIANISLAAVVTSWLITIATLGDHRFRVPTMGLSLLLQVATIWKWKQRISKAL